MTFPFQSVYNKYLQNAAVCSRVRKGENTCFVRISPRNGIVRWNMVSVREWRPPMAVRCWPADGRRVEIGSPIAKDELEKIFDLRISVKPVWLTDKLVWLGEIPRANNFESRYAIGERLTENGWVPDMLPDDTAMAYKGNEGLWIITGCSHSGINNIAEYAKRVCGEERICGIVGGFHLLQMSSQTHRTVEWLGDIRPKYLRPCHCTCFHARAAIHNAVPVQETCVGDTVVIE